MMACSPGSLYVLVEDILCSGGQLFNLQNIRMQVQAKICSTAADVTLGIALVPPFARWINHRICLPASSITLSSEMKMRGRSTSGGAYHIAFTCFSGKCSTSLSS